MDKHGNLSSQRLLASILIVALLLGLSAAGFLSQPVATDAQTLAAAVQVQGMQTSPVATPGGDLPGEPVIQLVKVAEDLIDPINVASAPDGSGRLFVVERPGRIQIIQDGQMLDEPFLDISGDVLSAFLEQGLYDVEFHPDFEDNGRFYVHFAELMRKGDSMIVEYQVSEDDPNLADPESSRVILQIDQPWANHNGGELAFGPDGYLYIGSGDGGWEGDPLGAGQDLSTLLGKILRIDVDTADGRPYAVPDDNPFAQPDELVRLFGITEEEFAQLHTDARPEIWAYGLRNPWKFSFDSETGDLYIAEVGQNVWEEIDFQPADSAGGENYGWDFLMGSHCFPIQAEECDQVGTLPIAEYEHELGSAVVGIGVYRGSDYPNLEGIYFASDYGSGRLWGLARDDSGKWQFEELLDTDLQITGAGEDQDGNLYLTSCNCNYGGPSAFENPPGALWQLVAADAVPSGAETAPVDAAQEFQSTGAATAEATSAETVEIELEAEDIAFDRETITVPAGARVLMTFKNRDAVPHNFALYETDAAENAIFVGEVITGPDSEITYEFDAPSEAGTYFFRCDIHPLAMVGDLIVQE